MIDAHQLTKIFRRGNADFAAVNGANLKLEAGEMAIITGPSGSGKSTLFHMLSGMIRPSGGTLSVLGTDMFRASPAQLARMRGTTLGYIMQGEDLLRNFTVLENICMPAALSGGHANIEAGARQLLEELGLPGMENEYPAKLSGGERRRVSIARALAHDPKLIIADEPTSNLDKANAARITESFSLAARRGVAVLVSTHDAAFADCPGRHFQMDGGTLQEK